MKWLRDILTGKDNSTHDMGRWMGVVSFLSGIGLEIYVIVIKGQPFDFTQFGVGIAAIAGGIGALIKLKESTEP